MFNERIKEAEEYQQQENYQEAITIYTQLLEKIEKILDPDEVDVDDESYDNNHRELSVKIRKNLEGCEAQLNNGKNIVTIDNTETMNPRNEEVEIMELATLVGDIQLIEPILINGLNTLDNSLFNLIENDSDHIANELDILLQQGAQINACIFDPYKSTPLHFAVQKNQIKTVAVFINKGADINIASPSNFKSAIEVAAGCGSSRHILGDLVRNRPSISLHALKEALAFCLDYYEGGYSNEAEDFALLNYTVSRLTRISVNALLYDEKHRTKYQSHLNSFEGKNKSKKIELKKGSKKKEEEGIDLEGWSPEHFLPMRIRAFFEVLFKLIRDDILEQDLPNITRQEAIEKLEKELLVELETNALRHDLIAIQTYIQKFKIKDNHIIKALYLNVVLNILDKLKQLNTGDEYVIPIGLISRGHCIYISLIKERDDYISIRIDNVGDGSEGYKYYLRFKKTHEKDNDGKISPKILGKVKLEEFSSDYLVNIFKLHILKSNSWDENIFYGDLFSNQVYEAIYHQYPEKAKLQDVSSELYEPKKSQSAGNCTVKNHQLGLYYRLNHPKFYKWLRALEAEFASTKVSQLPKNIQATDITREIVRERFFIDQLKKPRLSKILKGKITYYIKQLSQQQEVIDIHLPTDEKMLNLVCFEKVNKIHKIQEISLNVKDIVKKFSNLDKIMILGEPGAGKTTTLLILANKCLANELDVNFEAVFYIPLRHINQQNYPIKRSSGYQLIDVVNRECFANSLPNWSIEQIKQLIAHRKVLWLLDGYDELGSNLPSYLTAIINELTKQSNLILTSRTGFIDANQNQEVIILKPLSKSNYKEYLESLYSNEPNIALRIKSFIDRNPNIQTLITNPLLFKFICYLATHNQLADELRTLTDIYQAIMLALLRNFLTKEYGSNYALTDKKVLRRSQSELACLSEIAFLILQDSEHTQKLKEILIGALLNDRELFLDTLKTGFLLKTDIITKDNDIEFENLTFWHTTFNEFFFAYNLERYLNYHSNDEKYKMAISFIKTNKFDPKFQNSFIFLAGLLNKNQRLLQVFLSLLLDDTENVVNKHEISLLAGCFAEASIPENYKQKILERAYNFFSTVEIGSSERYLIKKLKKAPDFLEAIFNKIYFEIDKLRASNNKESPYELYIFNLKLIAIFKHKNKRNVELLKLAVKKWKFSDNYQNAERFLDYIRILIKWHDVLENNSDFAEQIVKKVVDVINGSEHYTQSNAAGVLCKIYECIPLESIKDFVYKQIKNTQSHIEKIHKHNSDRLELLRNKTFEQADSKKKQHWDMDYYYVSATAVLTSIILDKSPIISFLFEICKTVDDPPDEILNYIAIAELKSFLNDYYEDIIQEILRRIEIEDYIGEAIYTALNIKDSRIIPAINNQPIKEMDENKFTILACTIDKQDELLIIFEERLILSSFDFHSLPELVDAEDYISYKKSYIFIQKDPLIESEVFYITEDSQLDEIKINDNDMEKFMQKLLQIMGTEQSKHLSNAEVRELIPRDQGHYQMHEDFDRQHALRLVEKKLEPILQIQLLLKLLNDSRNLEGIISEILELTYKNSRNFNAEQKVFILKTLLSEPVKKYANESNLETKIWHLICIHIFEVDKNEIPGFVDIIVQDQTLPSIFVDVYEDYVPTPEWTEAFIEIVYDICEPNNEVDLSLASKLFEVFKNNLTNEYPNTIYFAKLVIAARGTDRLSEFFIKNLSGSCEFILKSEVDYLFVDLIDSDSDENAFEDECYTKIELIKILQELNESKSASIDFIKESLHLICSQYKTDELQSYRAALYKRAKLLLNIIQRDNDFLMQKLSTQMQVNDNSPIVYTRLQQSFVKTKIEALKTGIDEKPQIASQKTYPYSNKSSLIEDSIDNQLEKEQVNKAKSESLKTALAQEEIGPRTIDGWTLEDVDDKGNCFYEASADQLQLINHTFINTANKNKELHKSLRELIQGEDCKDREWANDNQHIKSLVENLDIIVAVVDTRHPHAGFVCYYVDDENEYTINTGAEGIPLPSKPIIKIAYTGNHFLSVQTHPVLTNGALRDVAQSNTSVNERQFVINQSSFHQSNKSSLIQNSIFNDNLNPEEMKKHYKEHEEKIKQEKQQEEAELLKLDIDDSTVTYELDNESEEEESDDSPSP